MIRCPSISTLFPYTTLFRSVHRQVGHTPGLVERHPRENTGMAEVAPDHLHPLASRPPDRIAREAVATGELGRSEEHTSELQSQSNLVCRLLLEKKKYVSLIK